MTFELGDFPNKKGDVKGCKETPPHHTEFEGKKKKEKYLYIEVFPFIYVNMKFFLEPSGKGFD